MIKERIYCMNEVDFDPRGKTFHFRLDKYTCYRCKKRNCSLDNISLDELKGSSSCVHAYDESSIEYCRGMAKLFLDNEFSAAATIYLNTQCGHYSFADGQHRTCVVARVLQKGGDVILKANITIQECMCRHCLLEAYYLEERNCLTWIDRQFKTARYRKIKKSEEDYKHHEFIYSF